MDLETVEFNSIQTPLTISFASEFETDNGYIVVKSEVLLNREGAPKGETTDSIFTKDALGLLQSLTGSDLGMFKDELAGQTIDQAIFLGIKQYGYRYVGGDRSVFAGVERNSLSFSDIQNLAEGGELTRATGPRFYKSFNSLNIRIKQDMQISIKASNNKRLIGNKYLPINFLIIESLKNLIL